MRKFVCASVFVMVAVTFAIGDFTATITEVTKDGKISYTKKAKKKGDEPIKGTIMATDKVKVSKGKFEVDGKKKKLVAETGDEAVIKGGLTNEMFSADKIGKGVTALFITEGEGDKEMVKEIILAPAKKKKDAQ